MVYYLFEVIDEDSDMYGEQFLVECEEIYDAWIIAQKRFPNEKLKLMGAYCPEEVEIINQDAILKRGDN